MIYTFVPQLLIQLKLILNSVILKIKRASVNILISWKTIQSNFKRQNLNFQATFTYLMPSNLKLNVEIQYFAKNLTVNLK